MSKITLNSFSSFQNDSTAVALINSNNSIIQTAIDNTLSRDGTLPNQMGATLDMNSNRIINLPTAISLSEPVTLGYLNSIIAGGNMFSGLITGVPVSAAMQPVVNAPTTAAALALLGGGVPSGSIGTPIDVFLIAGQSNAQGNSSDSSNSPTVPTNKVLQYYSGIISTANDPVGNANTGSAWPAFGNLYYAATGRLICFVPAAVGGTDQSSLSGISSQNWDATGTLYGISVSLADAALTALTTAGYSPRFCGVLWAQGENDASAININNITKAIYKAAFIAMIARYRSHYGAQMPFYIFGTGAPYTGDSTGYAQVRAAQKEVAEADNYTRLVFSAIDLVGLGLMQTSPQNVLHYTQTGYNKMGREGATSVIEGNGLGNWRRMGTVSTGPASGIYYSDQLSAVNVFGTGLAPHDSVNIFGPSAYGYLLGIHTNESGGLGIVQRLTNYGGPSVSMFFQPNLTVNTPQEQFGALIQSQYVGVNLGSSILLGPVISGVFTPTITLVNEGSLAVNSSLVVANGSVATALTSLGPTGAHSTVQEWLTIITPGGRRYIPCF